MKNDNLIVHRIKEEYVGENCVQVLCKQHPLCMTILNEDGVVYHYKKDSNTYINKYLTDERKEAFPYCNIPMHQAKEGLKKVTYVNQLFDFEKVYLEISNSTLKEIFAVKDGKEALLITKVLNPSSQSEISYLTCEQLNDILGDKTKSWYYLDGSLSSAGSLQEENLLSWYKKHLIDFKRMELGDSQLLTNYINNELRKITMSDIPADKINIFDKISIHVDDENMQKKLKTIRYSITFLAPDYYEVSTSYYGFAIFSLEHAKILEQTNLQKTKEPNILKRLNPNINEEEITKAKQLLLKRRVK